MPRITLLAVFLMALGCSEADRTETGVAGRAVGLDRILPDGRSRGVDPELAPFVRSFETLLGSSIGDIPVNFGDPGGGSAGVCILIYGGAREIKISRQYFDYLGNVDPDQREAIVWHELGHCQLLRGHREARRMYVDANGYSHDVASSVMFPVVDYAFFASRRDEYAAELFRRGGFLSGQDSGEDDQDEDLLDGGCVNHPALAPSRF